jgi:AraC-like DNA-binding protein
MFIEEFPSDQSGIRIDYMKGYVLPESTNRIQCHPYYEMLIISKGNVTYSDNKGVSKVSDKSIVFTKAYEVHNPSVNTTQYYERYRLSFEKTLFESLFRDSDMIDKLLSVSYKKGIGDLDFDEVMNEFRRLLAEVKKNDSDKLRECIHLLSLLVKCEDARPRDDLSEQNYIADVIDYVKKKYSEHLTAQDIATRFFISRGKLMYDFKSYCNMTLLEYITLTRIDAAKELLLEGYSVAAASEKCGFSTPSYFIKVFSDITHMTPLKFQIKFSHR